mmetsp:Transcript_13001/g.19432  ORF Transcript_13001/g.19432 Transcript_13001/m.19432 type:complete len:99 (+) Transcript_13001:1193-1489(+)
MSPAFCTERFPKANENENENGDGRSCTTTYTDHFASSSHSSHKINRSTKTVDLGTTKTNCWTKPLLRNNDTQANLSTSICEKNLSSSEAFSSQQKTKQ